MPPRLLFPDPTTAADVLTFARRAARVDDGAIRLRAAAGTLAMSAAALAPRGLLESVPTILGMRFLPIDPELACDLVVDAGALGADADPHAVALPDSAVTATWAGMSPPRTGWLQVGQVTTSVLAARAQWGIAAVAEALPADPGGDVVRGIREVVWGPEDPAMGGLVTGAAFAAHAFGFLGDGETAAILRSGTWTRVTLRRGHVLIRAAGQPSGLTSVRRTGAN